MAYDNVFGALGDPTRRRIIEILATGPHSVGSIAEQLPVSRPAVSQHLRKLSDAGLVEQSPDGQRNLYSLSRMGFDEVSGFVEQLWETALERFRDAAKRYKEERMKTIEPVTKVVDVPLDTEKAFELFTAGMESWWPFESHSVYQADKVSFEFEGRAGGRLIETGPEGEQSVWGTVDTFDPPHRISFSWHPGRDATNATQVEVQFEPVSGNGTRVTLIHSGWEELGDRAVEARKGYDSGWIVVFTERFGTAATAAATSSTA